MSERYVLATGEDAEFRLGVVNRVHGADTERFLTRSGLREGMRVADIGCGVGTVSRLLAGMVGESGNVSAIDISAEQVAKAQARTSEQGIGNITYHTANAYETGLPSSDYDLVFSRFVLMHLKEPLAALQEMYRLLRPNGILAVEDGDFDSTYCYPNHPAYQRCFTLYRSIGERTGADFLIGRKLYTLVRQAGFSVGNVSLAQPIFTRGDEKRLPEWTISECAPALIEAGLATPTELETLTQELAELAKDEGVVFAMARMTQIIAHKHAD